MKSKNNDWDWDNDNGTCLKEAYHGRNMWAAITVLLQKLLLPWLSVALNMFPNPQQVCT